MKGQYTGCTREKNYGGGGEYTGTGCASEKDKGGGGAIYRVCKTKGTMEGQCTGCAGEKKNGFSEKLHVLKKVGNE